MSQLSERQSVQTKEFKASVVPVVCDWDASSRRPGTSWNSAYWRSMGLISLSNDVVYIERRYGELVPDILAGAVDQIARRQRSPLTLGGDHRLSYSAIESLYHHHGPFEVHHFDAHHDSHSEKVLSNYTVFAFVRDRLGLPVYLHGCRESDHSFVVPSPGAPRLEKAYISVDLDYLDPIVFPAVSFPEPVPEGRVYSEAVLRDSIRVIGRQHEVIGADIVEWKAGISRPEHTGLVERILETLYLSFAGEAIT